MNNLFAEVDITLKVQNNTAYPQKINVLGNNANLLDTVNATTEYRWDVTTFTFGTENSVSVMYRTTSSPVYKVFVSQLANQSLQSIVDSLNILGIGYFNLYTELGQTYIGTYNENYFFALLNVYDSATPQVQYSIYTKGTGGVTNVTITPIILPPVTIIYPNPNIIVGDLTVVNGDIVSVSGTTSNYGNTQIDFFDVVNNFQSPIITLGASQPFNYGFTVGVSPFYRIIQVYEE